jgi:hypothetical protein
MPLGPILVGPYRKATPADFRRGAAFLAFLPGFIFGFARFGDKFLERADGFSIWLCAMGVMVVSGCFLLVWTKYVPQVVSWIIAAVTWTFTLWMAFTGRLV